MMKPILVSKLWRGKRGELWVCDKAARVKSGCTVVHSAGRFIGEFLVGRTRSFSSVRAALEWLGHEQFLPGSPSDNDTILFYYKLFTGERADQGAALAWDKCNSETNNFVC